jgi:hypothetical protein
LHTPTDVALTCINAIAQSSLEFAAVELKGGYAVAA